MEDFSELKARKRYHESNPLNTAILVTASFDHQIKFWMAHSGDCFKTIQYQDSQVNHMHLSSNKKLLAVAVHQQIRIYDVASSNQNVAFNIEGLSKNVTQVEFMAANELLMQSGEDGKLRMWDLRTRTSLADKTFSCQSPINAFCLDHNQKKVYMVDQEGCVHVCDMVANQKSTLEEKQGCSVLSVGLNNESTSLATVNSKGMCYTWRIQASQEVTLSEKFQAHNNYALKCCFSPDSTLLATTSADGTACLWRTSGNTRLMQLDHTSLRWVKDCAFSDDSQFLFTACSDAKARLWNITTGEVSRTYEGHQKALTCLSFFDCTS